uniref:Gag-Pol polyprotein n=1 Tax=Tanacetum cinerariifolium TaxID=118510 RepID=A0A6L2KRL9_TANCI|nr:hypothetical protein [Tanacetum cinerariifolium]
MVLGLWGIFTRFNNNRVLDNYRFCPPGFTFRVNMKIAFCLRSTAFCLQRSCVLPWKHCVLSTSKILRFALEALRFVYFKDLAFFLGTIAFCLPQRSCVLLWKNCVLSNTKILLFVLIAFCPISIEADIAFYPGPSITFCLTPNGEALRKCILSGPYKPTTISVQAVDATDDSLAVPEHTTVETSMNMSPENKAHFIAEKEAIHLILTGIGDDIYSTEFDKFTSHDEESMESYYTRFYKLMNEMIKNNLTMTTMQVNVQFLQQLQPKWSRFMTIVKQQHKLDEVSYHKLFDILKQYQNEVNELHAERLARNANPLALVATTQADRDQYYQTSRSHRSSASSPKPSIPSRSHTTTRHKGKEIAKPITPLSEIASEEDSDPE